MKRLAIIIPYRDREAHLRLFVPHVRSYFTRDKIDHSIPYRVIIVEQEPGGPFNRGALKNIGFALLECDADYVCFHDVDYLPTWADYSPVDRPTPIAWYGAETVPVAPGRSTRVVEHDPDTFSGGAVLIPNESFRAVDGYSNEFWGWGFEDSDLFKRFAAAGIETGRRRGTFLPLPHVNEGFRPEGGPSDVHKANRALLESKWVSGTPSADGLSTLRYSVLRRHTLPELLGLRSAHWELVTVRLEKA